MYPERRSALDRGRPVAPYAASLPSPFLPEKMARIAMTMRPIGLGSLMTVMRTQVPPFLPVILPAE
jgi:hypothetical protein